jgi:hypothetical protein
MGEAHGTRERDQKCLKMLVGNFEGKSSLGRPRRRQDNIKMDIICVTM